MINFFGQLQFILTLIKSIGTPSGKTLVENKSQRSINFKDELFDNYEELLFYIQSN